MRGKLRILLITLFIVVAGLLVAATLELKTSWQRDLPKYFSSESNRQEWARTIIHLHSVYSWDACDKTSLTKGRIDEPCLLRLRTALCRNHIDVAFLSEHFAKMGSTDFNSALNIRDGDTPIWRDGKIIESIQHCPDAHQAHLFPGVETSLMPIGLLRHPDPIRGSMQIAYSEASEAGVENLRNAGALVALSHLETKPLTIIRKIQPELLEIYNLHANVTSILRQFLWPWTKNPGHWEPAVARPQPACDPCPGKWQSVQDVLRYTQFMLNPFVEPDLLFLLLVRENEDNLTKWAQISLERHTTAFAGTDAHEGIPAILMRDGDRVDAYRRVMRWFSNFVQVDGSFEREAILTALKAGRVFVAFEILGTPDGFRFDAESDDRRYRMGDSISRQSNRPVSFFFKLPKITGIESTSRSPERILRLLRATENGWQEVARSTDADLRYETTDAGAYRAEIRMKPTHLKPYLFGVEYLVRDLPWIYTNPIYVK